MKTTNIKQNGMQMESLKNNKNMFRTDQDLKTRLEILKSRIDDLLDEIES